MSIKANDVLGTRPLPSLLANTFQVRDLTNPTPQTSKFTTLDSVDVITKKPKPFDKKDEINNLYFSELEKVIYKPREMAEMPDFTKTPFRIGIAVAQKQADFTIPNGTLYITDEQGKKEIGTFGNATFKVKAENNGISLYQADGKLVGNYKGKITLEGNVAPVIINSKKYYGSLEIISNPANTSTLSVINDVMLEDYLKGVVPSESIASWPEESLKAQAIAARTYTVANWKRRETLGFDLMATTSDQVYNGVGAEQASTNKAVAETNGKIMLYAGKPINALFFSCSGGYTDSSKDVWGVDLPYIQPVPDFDQKAPKYKWEKTYTNDSVKNALKQLGFELGDIKSIEPVEFTAQKRVTKIKFTGTKGESIVDSNKFRLALGLNSTLWVVNPSDSKQFSFGSLKMVPKTFTFNGGGWGHALGMSQWGASQMAADGKTAEEIVKHYYTGIEIDTINK